MAKPNYAFQKRQKEIAKKKKKEEKRLQRTAAADSNLQDVEAGTGDDDNAETNNAAPQSGST